MDIISRVDPKTTAREALAICKQHGWQVKPINWICYFVRVS